MITKKHEDSDCATDFISRLERHITKLENDAQELEDKIEKLDTEYANSMQKVKACEKVGSDIRDRTKQALKILEADWKLADSNKTKMRSLV